MNRTGSERGQDTKNHDATRRTESAAINRSLLALKVSENKISKCGAFQLTFRTMGAAGGGGDK